MSAVDTYEPPPNGFRTFLAAWVSQSVSVIGTALTFFAKVIWVTQTLYPHPEQKAELAFALSAMGIAGAVPIVFGAPIAGAWADRHDRKQTMIVADVAAGLMSLLAAVLMFTGTLQLWMLIVITAVNSVIGAFHSSAFDTSYAMLVPEKQLPRANGMMQTVGSLSGIVAPTLAAGIISLPILARDGSLPTWLNDMLRGFNDGAPLALTIDAVSFFAAAVVLLFLNIPSPKRADLHVEGAKKKSLWADVGEGFTYIWHRRPMLWLLGTFTVVNFVASGRGVFNPLMIKFNFSEDWTALGFRFETALALLGTVTSIGGVLGGIFISTWGGLKKRRVYGVLVPMIISGVAQVVFGLTSMLYLAAAMSFVSIGMIPILNAHSQTIWQTQTPRELQGRVFSVRRLIAQFTLPLGTVVAGLTAGVFNPGHVMAVMGAIMVVFCVGQMFNPYLIRVEDKAYLDELAAQAVARKEAA